MLSFTNKYLEWHCKHGEVNTNEDREYKLKKDERCSHLRRTLRLQNYISAYLYREIGDILPVSSINMLNGFLSNWKVYIYLKISYNISKNMVILGVHTVDIRRVYDLWTTF